jgi:hypothetical protein
MTILAAVNPRAGSAVFLGNHRSQPASFHQSVDKLLRIGFFFVDVTKVFVWILTAQLANCITNFLVLIGFVVHGDVHTLCSQ